MKYVITDKKVNLPNSIHAYAEKKVGKLDRFFREDATAAITFSVEKDRLNKIEITIRSNGTIFRVSESTSDMHASIDAAVTTLERQIRKNKTKLERRLREVSFDEVFNAPDTAEEETEYDVVRTKAVILKPQTVDEAILQMNMLGHEFYMFRNAESEEINVVYKRSDGGYSILEPDEAG